MEIGKHLDTSSMIRPNEFVVCSTKSLEENGVYKGSFLYVLNMQALPVDESDLYLQRLHAICHRVNSVGTLDTGDVLVIDANNLERMSKNKNDKFRAKLVKDYSLETSD